MKLIQQLKQTLKSREKSVKCEKFLKTFTLAQYELDRCSNLKLSVIVSLTTGILEWEHPLQLPVLDPSFHHILCTR